MVLHVHKSITEKISLTEIGNEFASSSSHRENRFGKFLPTDWEN